MEFTPGFLSISNHESVLIQSVFCEVSRKIAIDWFISQTAAKADINTVNVVVKHVPDFSASREKNDLGYLTFDLKVDLEPLFNWNVKQLFLYLSAEYSTPKTR